MKGRERGGERERERVIEKEREGGRDRDKGEGIDVTLKRVERGKCRDCGLLHYIHKYIY